MKVKPIPQDITTPVVGLLRPYVDGTLNGETLLKALRSYDPEELAPDTAVIPSFLNKREAARFLGASACTVTTRWCREGKLKGRKVGRGGHWRIPADEIRHLAEGKTSEQ